MILNWIAVRGLILGMKVRFYAGLSGKNCMANNKFIGEAIKKVILMEGISQNKFAKN